MATTLATVEKVGYVLWGAVLALGVVVGLSLVGGSATDSGGHDAVRAGPATPTDGQTDAAAVVEERRGVPVSLDLDRDGPAVDVGLDLSGVGVDVENAGHPSERQSVELRSDALEGETAESAGVGLCALGLGEENPSGVRVAVDGESGSVVADIDPPPDTTRESTAESARDVVERCSRTERS
ncbi:hypothetical protein [Halomarina rubra]|uniref:Uncharacterized protein n=1 Tax=Halomarina rubra TaxID=2071873 RepID=A0ABD6AYK0_9EURY|nr:hypothetical protein [Halomarina rubra]